VSQTNMRPEDRLAEKLKNDTLGAFFSEEDLLPMAKKAIEIAFFEWRDGPRYDSPKTPPLIVTAAQEHLEAEIKDYVSKMFDKLMDDEKFQSKMGEIMVSSLGTAMVNQMEQRWFSQFQNNMHQHSAMIAQILKPHL